ncbi:MAG TPA: hypothetical protein VFC38_05780 [Stellaceae bacterium]|nr:hypothetical protein [Stellaceae bacterium]
MILTPIPPDRLPKLLAAFRATVENPSAVAVFERISIRENAARSTGESAVKNHSESIAIAAKFSIAVKPGAPLLDFSWDGSALRADTEAYVLLHEIAHWQLAAPLRRARIDFALGPGPETGNRDAAERAQIVFGLAREREEAMASLLGILWEVELGHPALASFLDQNWLEGAVQGGAGAHFERILAALAAGGFIDADGRPTRSVRDAPDREAA